MRYLFIIYLLYLYSIPTRGDTIRKLNYLADRFQFVTNEFDRFKRQTNDIPHQQNQIDFGDSKFVKFDNTSEAHTFNLFNRNYLLSNGELYYVAPEDNKYILTSLKTFPEMHDEIAFIKTAGYNGIGFMFVCFVHDTVSHIYRFANDSLQPRVPIQTIKTINKLTDATFFINRGSLYLVLSSVLGVSMAPVIIYKWEESHFDDIDKVYVDGAISLNSFPNFGNSDSEIVIVLRKNDLENSNSYVYEFEDSKLRKIQILDDTMSNNLLTFNYENNTFLVVFNNASTSSLYQWIQNEFVLLHQFKVQPNVEKVFLSIYDGVPLIVTVTNENLMVFTLMTDTIQHLKTYNFDPTFSKIINLRITEFNGEKVVLILGLGNNHKLNFMLIPMMLQKIDIVSSTHKNDDFNDCMQQLEDLVEENAVELPFPPQKSEKLIAIPTENSENKVGAGFRENPSDKLQENFSEIEQTLQQLENKSKVLQDRLINLLAKDIVVVNNKVLLEGSLNAEKLSASSIRTKKLNGLNWEPERWLSNSADQIITTPMYIENFKVQDLNIHNDNGLFKDTLSTTSRNQTLFGMMRVGSLKAFNIFAPQINDVDMQSLYLRRNGVAPTKITGNKSFNNVNADDIHMSTLNGKNASDAIKLFGDPKALKYEFLPLVTVKNLEVETINDISWRNFSESVFRIGGNQTIQGNVTFAHIKTQFLQPQRVGGIPVEDLLTTSTPQTVNSIVHFRTVDTPNVRAKKVNDLDFSNNIATAQNGSSTLITGPVTIKSIHITGNLAINGSVNEFYKQNHIVGTHERDLLQIYNNKVRINGDLHLETISMGDAAKLFINGNEFNQANFNDYWSKTTNQEIPVHFEARNGIVTPHLNTKLLNDIPLDGYMVNGVGPKPRTTYVFENVTILGNVIIDMAKQHHPDLQRLNEEAVKLNGSFVVRGVKRFEGKVTIDNLKVDKLNNIQTKEFLTQSANNLIGNKIIKNLIVKSANVQNLTLNKLNGVSLEELYARTVFIDEVTSLDKVHFTNLTANYLTSTTINDKLFNEYIVELNQFHQMKSLNKLEVKGNVSLNKVKDVVYINTVNMPAIIEKMGTEINDSIRSNLFFDGKVHVKELFVSQMNNINMQLLLEQLYYRVWSQNVTARHTFKYLHAPNVFTPQINNIRTSHLINVKSRQPQLLKIDHGIRLSNPKFQRSLFTNISNCDIHSAIYSIHNIPKRSWKSILVDNITLIDNENPLARLLHNAVNTKKDNIILAPASLNHMYADSVFNIKQINGVDLHQIVNDALMYNATDQLVTGMKEFTKLTAAAIGIVGTTQIPIINNFDVLNLNQSILDKSEINNVFIEGRKTFFGGVQTDRLTTPVASGVIPENLVSLANLRPIPKAIFDDLTILNNLNIGIVNNQNFSKFLADRLLLHAGHDQITTANYYFDALQLNGKTTIPTINDIDMDDVVFDDGLQVINAPKKFTQRLEVQADAEIEVLNGFPVSDLYQQSILLQDEAHIKGNVNLLAPSQITGDIQAKSINGVPFDHINELLHSENHRVRIEIINDALHQIEGLVAGNTASIRRLPHQYMYLERSDDLQIAVEYSTGAELQNKKNGALLHVYTSEPGETCGFPSECTCPNQKTIKIQETSTSPNFFDNNYAQRIFSFESYDVIVDVITNTKSQSHICSSNTSQEYTSVNWYTSPGGNLTEDLFSYPEHITGFISDVKFFSLDGHIYVILAKLYDASRNASMLESLVLRIAKDKSQIEHVQKIRTNGAATLHLFHTAQGVNLVIGNVGGQLYTKMLTTDIYTFDRDSKLFNLLRSVPSTGCKSATSVVLGTDSLIILTQINNPIQVLKYNPFYKNYYFHESFLHETPITSVSVFYTGAFGMSDAYLTAVSERGFFYIYSYHYLIGWKLESDGQIEGLNALISMEINGKQYLFGPSSSSTSLLLTIVKQGV